MKRITSLILCALLLLSCAACGNSDGSENTENTGVSGVQGSADNSEEKNNTVPEYDGPWVVVRQRTNSYLYTDYLYDEAGRITEARTINTKFSATEPKALDTYTYSSRDDGTVLVNVLTRREEDFSGKQLVYSADGVCLERLTYESVRKEDSAFSSEKLKSKTGYEYDAQNRLTKADYSTYGEASVYAYDGNGRLVRAESWKNGECWETLTYSYNEKGDLVTEDSKNSVMGDAVYAYNCTYNYDGESLCKKSFTDEKGHEILVYDYEYDDQGRLTKITVDSAHDGLYPTEYFTGDGYEMEMFCFNGVGGSITLMPLALALEQQSAQ